MIVEHMKVWQNRAAGEDADGLPGAGDGDQPGKTVAGEGHAIPSAHLVIASQTAR